jgi:aminopeptidase-like protein
MCSFRSVRDNAGAGSNRGSRRDSARRASDPLPRLEAADLGADQGEAMHRLMAELYPICRSITGEGVRTTLARLTPYVPLTIHEVPSGTRVLDWTVPREWNIRGAWIKRLSGEVVVNFDHSNLHVVGYSRPVCGRIALSELRKHLHVLPEQPDWIPYRTSYYTDNWGFCVSQKQYESMQDEFYDVLIDTKSHEGSLTYGECFIEGEVADEVLFSCHVCHPSLCNDNLSGIVVAAAIAQALRRRRTCYSYRFLFSPGTIGAVTWLARNAPQLSRLKYGLVLTCVGDAGGLTYKRTRRGNTVVDRAFAYVLARSGREFRIEDFTPDGYDERQYNSPGFNLPVGCLMRTPHGRFPEYHTSADNLDFVRPTSLRDSLATCLQVIDVIESDNRYRNLSPFGEPQLGRRGLYDGIGGRAAGDVRRALLWLLNMSDGAHSLLDIAAKADVPWESLKEGRDALVEAGLLEPVENGPGLRGGEHPAETHRAREKPLADT